jgi:hypothetical protein
MIAMKTSITLLSMLTTTFLFAQEPVYWVGGTPGQKTSWHVARNWSNSRVPDTGTRVIINNPNTGHNAQPVISRPIEVLSIAIYNGATLQVTENGEILIDGTSDYSNGIQIVGSHLINDGNILMNNIDGHPDENLLSIIRGSGKLMLNEHLLKRSEVAIK